VSSRCRLGSALLLAALLVGGCDLDWREFFFHPTVADRVRENLSGELHTRGPAAVNPDSFRFALFGDPQVRADGTSLLGWFRQDAAAKGIDFFCVLGDLTNDGTAEEQGFAKAQFDSVGRPYYCTLGNHDLYQAGGWEWFKTTFGPSCYTVFIGGRVKLLFLDTADGMLGQAQFDWLESELGMDPRFVKIICTHFSIYDGEKPIMFRMPSTEERAKLISLLRRYDVHSMVSGHLHGFRYTRIDGTNYFISGMPPEGMDYGNPGYVLFTWAHDSLSWERCEYEIAASPASR
jgi:3',5'-cyclic AMP phosphodiesterase CpdA